MNLLYLVKQRMKQLKIPYEDVKLSDKPDKKIMTKIAGKWIHFGAKNSQTFLEGASEAKRDSYRARASKIKNKEGNFTYNIKYTPNFLSYFILWS
jgi:hypothetical protein